ncbi:MAG: hypothetical protein WC806_02645 [Candidatus Gracilibacteria bacterium]
MRKKIGFVMRFFILAIFMFVFSQIVMASGVAKKVKVEFKTPVATSDIPSFVKKYNLNPTELYFKEGEINGGYTVRHGESMETAIVNLKEDHASFLKYAIAQTKTDVDKATDDNMKKQIAVLGTTFSQAQKKFNSGNLNIYALELLNDDKLQVLQNNNLVVAVELPRKESYATTAVQKEIADITTTNSVKSSTHESWAPYGGTSDVNQTRTYQTFYFNKVSDFGSTSTYESESQVYDKKYADYNNYWCSNLPNSYYDTPFLDSIDNFTIGSSKASSLVTGKQYYTNMSLKKGTVNSALIRIKGQKGHRTPSFCYSTWCIFADATTGSMAVFTAPGGMCWAY